MFLTPLKLNALENLEQFDICLFLLFLNLGCVVNKSNVNFSSLNNLL